MDAHSLDFLTGWRRKLRLGLSCVLLCCAGMLSARGEAMLELFNVSWSDLIQKMPEIAEAGYDSLWLPPPAKGRQRFFGRLRSVRSVRSRRQKPARHDRHALGHQRPTDPSGRDGASVRHPRLFRQHHEPSRRSTCPGYNASTPTNFYPAWFPQDFHLQTVSGGFFHNWPSVEDYGNQWEVQYESLSGLIDLANEPGTVNGNFGNTLGSTIAKPLFIRQPANPEYYMDTTTAVDRRRWHPFNGTNGVPVAEDVNAYLIRAAMWTCTRRSAMASAWMR